MKAATGAAIEVIDMTARVGTAHSEAQANFHKIACWEILPDGQQFSTVGGVGLRERKKLDTRRALSDAALHLMFERGGLENVTREDIAAMAGVSVRTFNNYFTGKYEALAYRQTERMRRSIELLRERPADEPLWTAITEAVIAPLQEDMDDVYGQENALPTRRQLVEVRKILTIPQIRDVTFRGMFDEWVAVIAERTGTDPGDRYPRLVAAVVRAVGDVAMDEYAGADPPVSFPSLLREGFAAVAAGLPEPKARV